MYLQIMYSKYMYKQDLAFNNLQWLISQKPNQPTTLSNIFIKITENIFKYYRLNFFKEIAIGFNHSLWMSWEPPASLSSGLPV